MARSENGAGRALRMYSPVSCRIRYDVDLRPFNSFGVSANAAQYILLDDFSDLPAIIDYSKAMDLSVLLLGGGSNLLLIDDFPGLVIHMGIQGVRFDASSGSVTASAGENWHSLVENCLNRGFHGLENLALIPGSVGAAPIQNIGAYGVELEQFLDSVGVYDSRQDDFRRLSREQCQFAYRDSLFRQEQGEGLIITDIRLKLHRHWQANTSYRALRQHLGTDNPAHRQLFEAVCQIRGSKLPDPAVMGNAGSFFKNPVIAVEKYHQLRKEIPQLPAYTTPEQGKVKIPAAGLLDALGWKGCRHGRAAVHSKHALVLVNTGEASGAEINQLAVKMCNSVFRHFGIILVPEVRVLP